MTERSAPVYSPFSLRISAMERLLLINFARDPDTLYLGFEPQWFDDPSYGRGLRIIAWRRDGYVDVYQQPGLTREARLDVAAKGLAETLIRPMAGAYFRITDAGVDVRFSFEDKAGRAVEVTVVEGSPRPRRPFSLLAPVGSASVNPSALPVYLMFMFDFVRRSRTAVAIRIAGRMHRPDPFPLPMGGARVYFMRYSADTFLVDWCPDASQALVPLRGRGSRLEGPDNTVYELSEGSNPQESGAIARIRASRRGHQFTAAFDPPFPEITQLAEGAALDGRCVLGAEDSAGAIHGIDHVHRRGREVTVRLRPSGGWRPHPDRLLLRVLYRVATIFRRWPRSYQWTATITLRDREPPFIESRWERLA